MERKMKTETPSFKIQENYCNIWLLTDFMRCSAVMAPSINDMTILRASRSNCCRVKRSSFTFSLIRSYLIKSIVLLMTEREPHRHKVHKHHQCSLSNNHQPVLRNKWGCIIKLTNYLLTLSALFGVDLPGFSFSCTLAAMTRMEEY